ncbi:MAG: aminotransferase class I/II-fold pyridoxal phosphate-dependent enzyme, partial [Actinobacteria bacterium]|nr:aminotransferase class I/II-fold pyridoxal phosphate-dependent enzyme [Actinomycetota bacterium]
PIDPPPASVIDALSSSNTERGYPPSIGSLAFREAAARWMARIADVHVDPVTQIGATVGTKEFVAGTPHYLRMRRPDRDTVLYPEVSYPSYEQGAIFSGCRAVAVPVDEQWRIDLTAIDPDDAARALCLWVNTPGNPAGGSQAWGLDGARSGSGGSRGRLRRPAACRCPAGDLSRTSRARSCPFAGGRR